MLRNSILIGGMLTNAEIWYHMQTSETDDLERVDRQFFFKILGTPRSVTPVALYLETGTMPLSMVIKVRRLM